jgi:hypothetical protein
VSHETGLERKPPTLRMRGRHVPLDEDGVSWRDMSKVGDVVFCVDCDLARNAHLKVAIGDSSGAPQELPRRMATKRDGSDPLCTACLDARVQRRRAAFLQPRAPSTDSEPQAAVSSVGLPTAAALRGRASRELDTPVRRLSSVRIARIRPVAKSAAPQPLDKKRVVAEIVAEAHQAAERASTAKALEARARALQLAAAEIGLARAHELLAQIRAAALTVVTGTR